MRCTKAGEGKPGTARKVSDQGRSIDRTAEDDTTWNGQVVVDATGAMVGGGGAYA